MIKFIIDNAKNKNLRRSILVLIDSFIISLSFLLGLFVTNNFLTFKELIENIIFSIFSGIIIYILSGQYQPITKYIINSYLYKIVLRNTIISFFIFIWVNIFQGKNFNINFYIVFITNLTLVILITRLLIRDIILITSNLTGTKKVEVRNIAIYGAGSAGIQLLSALKYSNLYKVKFFIDDSEYFRNRIIDDKPIFPFSEINKYKKQIDYVFLAIPSLSLKRKSEIIKSIRSYDLNIQIIPSLEQITSGKSKIESLRNPQIKDLLGRDPVVPDKRLLTDGIKGKNICITGAGGSIGKALCRSIINLNPSKIILIENNELSLYSINEELRNLSKENNMIFPYLINLLDLRGLEHIFNQHKVDSIFHAAAYKHVPLVEFNPINSIKNNVISTMNICSTALKFKIANIVQISSDKAVRPTNLMGATKRICELIFIDFQKKCNLLESKNTFSIVRFGNVLGSSGSVIPLFKKQIEEGGPITITHPEIIRYFMTEEEASQLVIQSAMLSKGGDIFLLDMGIPKKIIDLAREMIWLSGMKEKNNQNPNGDIEIIYTGLRPGEKLYEEMLIESNAVETIHPRIFQSKESENFEFNFSEKFSLLIDNIKNYDEKKSILSISEIVPDWKISKEIKKILFENDI